MQPWRQNYKTSYVPCFIVSETLVNCVHGMCMRLMPTSTINRDWEQIIKISQFYLELASKHECLSLYPTSLKNQIA